MADLRALETPLPQSQPPPREEHRDRMPGWLARKVPSSPSLGPPLYKWRDAQGRLHVTDTPPADRPYETVRYDPATNVVPGGSPKH